MIHVHIDISFRETRRAERDRAQARDPVVCLALKLHGLSVRLAAGPTATL